MKGSVGREGWWTASAQRVWRRCSVGETDMKWRFACSARGAGRKVTLYGCRSFTGQRIQIHTLTCIASFPSCSPEE